MKHYIGQSNPMHAQLDALANYKAQHFAYAFEDGWNYPGDAFMQDADGYFFYQARDDDMIITSGYNVAGPEVEDALLKHPAAPLPSTWSA